MDCGYDWVKGPLGQRLQIPLMKVKCTSDSTHLSTRTEWGKLPKPECPYETGIDASAPSNKHPIWSIKTLLCRSLSEWRWTVESVDALTTCLSFHQVQAPGVNPSTFPGHISRLGKNFARSHFQASHCPTWLKLQVHWGLWLQLWLSQHSWVPVGHTNRREP